MISPKLSCYININWSYHCYIISTFSPNDQTLLVSVGTTPKKQRLLTFFNKCLANKKNEDYPYQISRGSVSFGLILFTLYSNPQLNLKINILASPHYNIVLFAPSEAIANIFCFSLSFKYIKF